METGRKTRLRRILRRKRIKRAIKAYGNYIAAVPVDISEIDLKKFWGIAFQLAAVAQTLQEETDICTACPYTYTDEQCTGCGTYWNMRDLRLDFEAIQQRLIKAATEE